MMKLRSSLFLQNTTDAVTVQLWAEQGTKTAKLEGVANGQIMLKCLLLGIMADL